MPPRRLSLIRPCLQIRHHLKRWRMQKDFWGSRDTWWFCRYLGISRFLVFKSCELIVVALLLPPILLLLLQLRLRLLLLMLLPYRYQHEYWQCQQYLEPVEFWGYIKGIAPTARTMPSRSCFLRMPCVEDLLLCGHSWGQCL